MFSDKLINEYKEILREFDKIKEHRDYSELLSMEFLRGLAKNTELDFSVQNHSIASINDIFKNHYTTTFDSILKLNAHTLTLGKFCSSVKALLSESSISADIEDFIVQVEKTVEYLCEVIGSKYSNFKKSGALDKAVKMLLDYVKTHDLIKAKIETLVKANEADMQGLPEGYEIMSIKVITSNVNYGTLVEYITCVNDLYCRACEIHNIEVDSSLIKPLKIETGSILFVAGIVIAVKNLILNVIKNFYKIKDLHRNDKVKEHIFGNFPSLDDPNIEVKLHQYSKLIEVANQFMDLSSGNTVYLDDKPIDTKRVPSLLSLDENEEAEVILLKQPIDEDDEEQ